MEALLRTGLAEIERLALRDTFGNVEENDIAKLFQRGDMGERSADLSGADQCDLWACHVFPPDFLLHCGIAMPGSRQSGQQKQVCQP